MDIVGKGFWIQISSRFAAESTCDACLLCVNARDDWIFERDELYNGLQRLWQCTIQNYTLTIRAITLARHIRNRIGGNCKRYNTPGHTYSTKYGLYEEISKLGDFQDIINSSKLSIGEILITKTGDGKITVSRLGDLPGEGIRNGTIGKVIENKAGISGIKKITNSEQGNPNGFWRFYSGRNGFE